MPEVITWTVSSGTPEGPKKLPFIGAWKTFSKLPEDEKEKAFNAMRGVCMVTGLMENK